MDLHERHCTPQPGPALGTDEAARWLTHLTGWSMVDGSLQKAFEFEDFHRTMAFANAVAWLAHREDHHPQMQLSHGRCVLRWHTHSVAGLSINDFICAAKVDACLS